MSIQFPSAACRGVLSHVAPAAILVAFSAQASAQQAGRVERLEEINVVTTSTPTPNDQAGGSVTVITSEQIQKLQRRSAPEILQTVPGLNVVQTGGPGGYTSVYLRGTNANHVKVLIDGIDVSDPGSANLTFDFGQLLAGDIERVEILRGPQSGLYGSDAIGGVISITTKKGEGPAKISGFAEGGSFGTLNSSVGVRGSHERVNYSFNLQRQSVGGVPVTPPELVPPGTGINDNRYGNWTFSTKLGAQITDVFGVNLVGRYMESRLHSTSDDFGRPYGFAFGSPNWRQDYQRDKQDYIRGEATANLLDGRFKNWFGVSHMRSDTWAKPADQTPTLWSSGLQPPYQYVGERAKFDWRGEFEVVTGHKIIAGAETQREWMTIPSLDPSQTAIAAAYSNTAGYVEYVGNFADRFFLVANTRYDRSNTFGGHATYRIAPSFHMPWTGTILKASYGTGFKAPSLNQLYVSYPAFFYFANPNLQPEQSRGFEIGFEQPLLDDRLRFGATYFRNRIKNLIESKYDQATFTSTLVNLGAGKTYGVEAFAQARINDQLTLRADYTYTVARNASPPGATLAALQNEYMRQLLEGTPQPDLLRRPRHKASLQATWKPIDKLSLSASVIRVSSWIDGSRDFTIPRLRAPGYTLVNLAGSYEFAEGVTATARVDNLLNRQYQNPTGFRAPGIGAYAGLRVSY
ncbi:MAG: TonB-dependent receptor plug domain-containing protein [Rhodoblastus sp.]